MGEIMSRAGWWLADLASQLLDPHERDAVRGDLVEARVSGSRAFAEVLGLIARRQSALWADWRPWLAVLLIVMPIGLMLSHASRWWADGNALNISLYVRIWEWDDLGYPGWRRDLAIVIWGAAVHGAALAGWSWTSGFVLASLSRRTAWMAVTLFALVLFIGTIGTTTIARTDGTFAGHFFAVVFPRLFRTMLVLVPALWGLRTARRRSLSPRAVIAGAVLLALVTVLASDGLEDSLVLGRGAYRTDGGPDGAMGTADDPRPLWPVSLVMLWPMGYILISTIWHRARISSSLS